MLFAAIDIGSNAVRLYFANVFVKNNIVIAEKASLIRIPVRLGEDVFEIGYITDAKRDNLIKTMAAFKLLIDVYKPVNYTACATSAMREASNNTAVIKDIKEKAGIDVKIIDGLEEARIVCATNNLEPAGMFKYAMYIDVGGGSTDISVVQNHKLISSNSFKIGTIRMLCNKVEKSEWAKMKNWLITFSGDFDKFLCIGSGGNINKLAKIYGKYEDRTLSYTKLEKGYKQIVATPVLERIEKMGMRPDRADVIEPAAKIFLTIMKTINASSIYVPKIGLSDGLIYMMYNNNLLQEK